MIERALFIDDTVFLQGVSKWLDDELGALALQYERVACVVGKHGVIELRG